MAKPGYFASVKHSFRPPYRVTALRAVARVLNFGYHALANPVPEVQPEDLVGIARVVATGRSDYPNQINNSLAFPGVFRGALDARASDINAAMKLAAAEALASLVADEELNEDYIIPSMFDARVVPAVATAVRGAAFATGVARLDGPPPEATPADPVLSISAVLADLPHAYAR